MTSVEPVLEAQHLKKHFPVTRGLALQRTVGWVRAVEDVSFVIRPGRQSVWEGGAEGVPLERAGGLSGPVGLHESEDAGQDHRW
jgi:hypothetical protein